MRFVIILSFLVLSGCCTFCKEQIKEVYVKTGCEKPPTVTAPALKTTALSTASTYKEIVEAYVFDVLSLKEYSTQLVIALEPYKSCNSRQ